MKWLNPGNSGAVAAGNVRLEEHNQPQYNFCLKTRSLLQCQSSKLKPQDAFPLFHWTLNLLLFIPGSVSLIILAAGRWEKGVVKPHLLDYIPLLSHLNM